MFSSWENEARGFVLGRFNRSGLLGLYILIVEHFGVVRPLCWPLRFEPRPACASSTPPIPRFQEINAVLRLLALSKLQPTLLHCTHGKDRTGITMAIVERLLGVDDPTIIADYHLSDKHGQSEEGRAAFAHVPELVRRTVGI